MAEIVRQCLTVGASQVVVFDNTCDFWSNCYQNSGIAEAATAAGARVVPGHQETYYRAIPCPEGLNSAAPTCPWP